MYMLTSMARCSANIRETSSMSISTQGSARLSNAFRCVRSDVASAIAMGSCSSRSFPI